MTAWLVLAALTALISAMLLWPLLRRRGEQASRADYDLTIYRDQLRELERDRARGLLSPEEAAAAETEVRRRVLAVAQTAEHASDLRRSPWVGAGLVTCLAGLAFGLYGLLGAPGTPDQPLAQRQVEPQRQQVAASDLEKRVALLAEKAAQDPENFEQWWMLGRSYAFLERYAEAAEAYGRAVELSGDRPDVLSTYAEALVLANDGRVTPAARLAFEKVRAAEPDEPRARYYLALNDAQAGRYEAAMQGWLGLLRDAPADAPWRPLLRQRVAEMAEALEIDAASVLPEETTPQPSAADETQLRARIADIRARLAAQPKDFEGWLALAQAHAALGEREAAGNALRQASDLYAAAPFVQQQIRRTAAALDIELEDDASARGPSREDVAAAAEMNEQERQEMIAGMVEGLAARLEAEPDNLQGWLMLIRSYSVLGERAKAKGAAEQALSAFDGAAEAQGEIRRTAAAFGVALE